MANFGEGGDTSSSLTTPIGTLFAGGVGEIEAVVTARVTSMTIDYLDNQGGANFGHRMADPPYLLAYMLGQRRVALPAAGMGWLFLRSWIGGGRPPAVHRTRLTPR